jgi:hypothetical protein
LCFLFPCNVEHRVELVSEIRRCACHCLAGCRRWIVVKVMLSENMVRTNIQAFHATIASVQRTEVAAHGLSNTWQDMEAM